MRHQKNQRGVSLVEALVALAVMAFGMLGVAGLQSSLRLNSDVSRQRSEAIRLAQEAIESARSFTVVQVTAGKVSFDGLTTGFDPGLGGPTTSNTVFTRTVTVVDHVDQNLKTVIARVGWTDRSDTPQYVRLATTIHRMSPEIAGSLSVSGTGTVVQLRSGRNAAVPAGAVDLGDGTSRFAPPNAGTVGWVFNNTTGYITSICNGASCTAVDARLLSGFINFATSVAQPTAAQAEAPNDTAFAVQARVLQTLPDPATAVDCYQALFATYVSYVCALPVDSSLKAWSGRSELVFTGLATALSDVSAASYKVCRYTPYRDNRVVDTGSPKMTNQDHPYDYLKVSTALLNQNFLVMKAGDNTTASVCPNDNAGVTPVNTNTWHHQPAS